MKDRSAHRDADLLGLSVLRSTLVAYCVGVGKWLMDGNRVWICLRNLTEVQGWPPLRRTTAEANLDRPPQKRLLLPSETGATRSVSAGLKVDVGMDLGSIWDAIWDLLEALERS